MSEESNKSLSLFMKKQISEKSSKKKTEIKADAIAKAKKEADKKNGIEQEEVKPGEEDMTDEEKLEEAKKASRNKAAEMDQTEMFKKMLLENIVKYTVLVAVLVMFAIGIIKFGPAIMHMLDGLLTKILLGAIKK